jgi:hypothetical protein
MRLKHISACTSSTFFLEIYSLPVESSIFFKLLATTIDVIVETASRLCSLPQGPMTVVRETILLPQLSQPVPKAYRNGGIDDGNNCVGYLRAIYLGISGKVTKLTGDFCVLQLCVLQLTFRPTFSRPPCNPFQNLDENDAFSAK